MAKDQKSLMKLGGIMNIVKTNTKSSTKLIEDGPAVTEEDQESVGDSAHSEPKDD